jgi:hypothetical protein
VNGILSIVEIKLVIYFSFCFLGMVQYNPLVGDLISPENSVPKTMELKM